MFSEVNTKVLILSGEIALSALLDGALFELHLVTAIDKLSTLNRVTDALAHRLVGNDALIWLEA